MKPVPVLRMLRMLKIFAQVDEGPRDLNEPFVKGRVLIAAPQPDLLKNIMRLVILARMKALEKCHIPRRIRPRILKTPKKLRHPLALAHLKK